MAEENRRSLKVDCPNEMFIELTVIAMRERMSMKEMVLSAVSEKWLNGEWEHPDCKKAQCQS
jgi:hypothetical protein